MQAVALTLLWLIPARYNNQRPTDMHWINWVIVIAYVAYVIVDGIRRSKDTDSIAGYFVANRSLSWWVVGLSVMATQLSAVTMMSERDHSHSEELGQLVEQRTAELAASNERLRNLVNALEKARDAIELTDPEANYEYVNPARPRTRSPFRFGILRKYPNREATVGTNFSNLLRSSRFLSERSSARAVSSSMRSTSRQGEGRVEACAASRASSIWIIGRFDLPI